MIAFRVKGNALWRFPVRISSSLYFRDINGCYRTEKSISYAEAVRQTDNADPDRIHANQHRLAQSAETAMTALKARLPEKRRKDAVLAIEYVMTASPEWFESGGGASARVQQAFFDRSVKWLEDKYGSLYKFLCKCLSW